MVTVTVTGHVNEGKTTIAAIIEKALKEHGFRVANHDPDVHFGTNNPHLQGDRVRSLLSRKETIEIEVAQLSKVGA